MMHTKTCYVGIDDTDSPEGMCTTYLASLLIRRYAEYGFLVLETRLIRLNPTIRYKTRGNAAIAIIVLGDPDMIFALTCGYTELHARFDCDNTNPGVVVSVKKPDAAFYRKAVTDICTLEDAEDVLNGVGALYRGYKNKRGLIGATAAIASSLPDYTWELLAYREPGLVRTPRQVEVETLFTSEEVTTPHTWDTVDVQKKAGVCVPHSGDPVLFGIRGDSPFSVARARSCIRSESPVFEQIFRTNQGTDVHLLEDTDLLQEGRSYMVRGTVLDWPVSLPGGHVLCRIQHGEEPLDCMAYEPTKGFRNVIRALIPGDRLLVCGSYTERAMNIEKICISWLSPHQVTKAPVCDACQKQMTSAGTGKGWKCRKCGKRLQKPDVEEISRELKPGWYEVPPCARRHLSKPLIREKQKQNNCMR